MNPRNKVWITLAVFVLVLATIACSCGALNNIINNTSNNRGGGSSSEGMPGLAGTWRDAAESDEHTIQWTGSTYHVVSSVNDNGVNYDVTSENWDGSTFTWTYEVPQDDGSTVSVTIQATSVDGDNLNVTWSSTNGNSGTDTFSRQ
jgi:hypothetical protein